MSEFALAGKTPTYPTSGSLGVGADKTCHLPGQCRVDGIYLPRKNSFARTSYNVAVNVACCCNLSGESVYIEYMLCSQVAPSQATCALLRHIELRGDVFLATTFAALAGLSALLHVNDGLSVISAVARSSLLVTVHLACVAAVVAVYRISPLHPLHAFPGPLINKITALKQVQMVASGKRYLIVEDLHAKYGTFVRVGTPRELLCCSTT